ncbi:MAG: hypothetical protein JWO06_2695 [Bacteroidota bacterium]|nr:hypothetical protein [Bacteroidota bacterium]
MAAAVLAKNIWKWLFKPLLIFSFSFLLLEFFLQFMLIGWPPIYQSIFDDEKKIYIYMVGESTAEGIHYEKDISPAKLVAYQFNGTIDGKTIEIVPLAKSGATFQYHYLHFLSEVLFRPHKNGLVLVYAGINEATENTPPSNDFDTWKLIQGSLLLSNLYYLYEPFQCCPQKYEYHYRKLMKFCNQRHYKMVVSQLVGNIADFEPDITSKDDLLFPDNLNLLHQAKQALAQKDFSQAENVFNILSSKTCRQNAHLLYYRGRCKYEQGQYDSAEILINQAPEISNYLGFARWKNDIIEKVALDENVPVAHCFNRFLDSSEHRLPGYDLIDDAHHPNLRGYCIMANEISSEISKIYGDKIRQRLSPSDVVKEFKFSSESFAHSYYRLTEWYIFECLKTKERDARLSRLKFYCSKYEGLNPDDGIILIWKSLEATMGEDQQLFLQSFRKLDKRKDKKDILDRLKSGFSDKPQYRQELRSIVLSWSWHQEADIKLRDEFIAQLP